MASAATESVISALVDGPTSDDRAGFWLTCARSIASSSGGTSLHGSAELVERVGSRRRSFGRS